MIAFPLPLSLSLLLYPTMAVVPGERVVVTTGQSCRPKKLSWNNRGRQQPYPSDVIFWNAVITRNVCEYISSLINLDTLSFINNFNVRISVRENSCSTLVRFTGRIKRKGGVGNLSFLPSFLPREKRGTRRIKTLKINDFLFTRLLFPRKILIIRHLHSIRGN